MEIKVANVLGMITYDQELDLSELATTFSKREEVLSVVYDPSKNHWLQTRFGPDETYVAFYRSGRCSITGCNSIEGLNSTAAQVNELMRDLLEIELDPSVEISNIVATTDLQSAIPLEVLCIELGMENTEYEPEQFPALVYRGSDHVILIFASGKLVCTGLSDLDSVSESVKNVRSQIQSDLDAR